MKKSLVFILFFAVFFITLLVNNFDFYQLNRVFALFYFLLWIVTTVVLFLKNINNKRMVENSQNYFLLLYND